jgi:hypothetical protein
MRTDNWQKEPIPVDWSGLIHSNQWESLADDQILDSRWQIALQTQSKHAHKMKYLFCQQQKVKHNTCRHKAPNYERRRREGSKWDWKMENTIMCNDTATTRKTWVQYRHSVVRKPPRYCRGANLSQYLTAPWVQYVDNGTGTTGVPQQLTSTTEA